MHLQIFFNIWVTFSIYLLCTYSFTLIYHSHKFFHLAHALSISIGAYTAYHFNHNFGLNLLLSSSIAILFTILFFIGIELSIYNKLRQRNATPLVFLIVSLGIYIVFQNLLSLLFGDNTLSFYKKNIIVGNEYFGAFLTNNQIIIIFVCIFLYFLSLFFIKYTKVGRCIRAISSNHELANIFGISSNKVYIWTISIGSGLGAITGILFAIEYDLNPTMGFRLLLYGVVVMIVGGVRNSAGLVLSALFLSSAQNLTSYYIDSNWIDTISYLFLIFFLIWKPSGISGQKLKKIEI